MKQKLFTLMTLLLTVCSGAWAAPTEVVLFNGTNESAACPDTNEHTDATTGFKYKFDSFKSTGIDVSAFTGTGIVAGTYNKAYRYNGGTTSSANRLTITIPEGYTATIDVIYCLSASATIYFGFGASDGYEKPASSNSGKFVWYGTASATSTLYSATISNVADGSYILGASGDKGCLAYVKATITSTSAAVAPSEPTLTVDGGSVEGNSTTTISSANAQKIYYCWTSSATAPAQDAPETWTEAVGSSYEYTIPNVTANPMYLHAYGWNNYKTSSTSDTKTSNAFNVTKVKLAAELSYATAAITKNVGDANFTNELTNPHSLTVTYSVVDGATATGVEVNSSTGEVTIGSVAGTATIKATSAETEDYLAGEATYILTVTKKVETPSYAVGPYDYKQGGYKVTVSCPAADATLKYVLTTSNPDDGTQSTYFDGEHGTIYTYTEPFYTTGKRVIIQASKEGYDDSYSVKGSRYQVSDAPEGTSPEVVIWNVKGNGDGEKNADHGNRAVSIVGGHYAQGNTSFGTNGLKMRVSPNSITTLDGVTATRCMQIKVNKGYLVTKVKFNKIHENSSKVAIPVSNVYVDGVALAGFESFDIPKSSASALENKEIDLSGAANGGAKSSVILVFGESTATQYNAITTITYARQTEAISTKSERSFATYVTLNDLDFSDASVADNIVAYKATGSTSGVVALTALDKVPAGTPILVKTTTKGDSQNVPYATTAVDPITGNKLVAGDGSTAMGGDSNYDYVLKEDAFHRASAGTVATGKAYLHLDEPAARVLALEFGDNTTGIQEVNTDKKGLLNGEFYNVAGQRVALPKNGLYIVNGRKVIVK